jgi:La-related protein 7
LDTFTKFNKLRKLTTDLSVVAKALKRSNMLELSADGASVRRKVPFQEPKDADARTVYVVRIVLWLFLIKFSVKIELFCWPVDCSQESLPPDVTIEWMQQTFGVCGRVVYVSLPRYKYTRYLKGFAFVEFESAESAQTACKVSFADKIRCIYIFEQ